MKKLSFYLSFILIFFPTNNLYAWEKVPVPNYVDKKMMEVHKSANVRNATKIAILAALNISDELFNARRGEYSFKGEVESKVKSLIERIEEITD